MKFKTFVKKIKKILGVPVLLTGGNVEKTVRTVVVSQGAAGLMPVLRAIECKADAVILGESVEWQAVRLLEDSGIPCVITGHCVSENQGMRDMIKLLREKFPGPEYIFLDAGNPFTYI